MSRQTAQIIDLLPNYQFKVRLQDGKEIRCVVCGKMRMASIKLLLGDKVELEYSETGGNKIGRIKYRLK